MRNLQNSAFIRASVQCIFYICISVPAFKCVPKPRHVTLLINKSFIYHLLDFVKRYRAAIFSQTSS